MKKFEVKDHEPSFLPEGEWKLVWADEFDGTELDRTKWDFRLNFWGKPFDAYTDQGIVLAILNYTEQSGMAATFHHSFRQAQTHLIYQKAEPITHGDKMKYGLWVF